MASKKKAAKSKKPAAPAKKAPAKKAAKKPAAPAKKAAPAPAAKAGQASAVGPAALAKALGVELRPPLEPAVRKGLKQPPAGANAMLASAAGALETESVSLGLGWVTPAILRAIAERRERIHALEDIARAVYRSLHEERLVLDDQALSALHRIARRVGAQSEEHGELLGRWRFLRDFLARPTPARSAAAAPDEDEDAEESAES